MPTSARPAEDRLLPTATEFPSGTRPCHARYNHTAAEAKLGDRGYFQVWPANNHHSALDSGGQKLGFKPITTVLPLGSAVGGRLWRSKLGFKSPALYFFLFCSPISESPRPTLNAQGRRSQGFKPRLLSFFVVAFFVWVLYDFFTS